MTINEKKMRNSKIKKAIDFDLLVVTESLGYKTYRKNRRNSWSREEDNRLKQLINTALIELGFSGGIVDIRSIQESERVCKNISWEHIANLFNDPVRKPKDLKKRWTASLDPNLKKGKWTPEEDKQLLKAYGEHGSHWQSVAEKIAGRTEDQCAKRYIEVLGPSTEGRLRKWTMEEDLNLVNKVKKYGTKWRRISSEMEFRPSLTCRNRWRKIITSVVRNKASPEIADAVKGDQDVSLSMDKFSTTKDVQDDPDSEDEEQEIGSSNESGGCRHEKGFDDEVPRDEEGGNDGSDRQNYDYSNPSVPFVDRQADVHEAMLVDGRPFKQFPDSLVAGGAALEKKAENRQSDPNKSSSFPNILEPLPSMAKLYSQDGNSVKNGTHKEQQGFDEDRAKSRVQQKPPKTSIQYKSHMEWKFILKDEEELSVSSGVINNLDLVKELITQAKKNSLKISIHQHIHNHYSTPQEIGNDHQRSSFVPDVYSNLHTNNSSPSSGDSSKDILSNAGGTVKPTYPEGYQDFLSGSPSYNAFELGPFPQLDVSPSGIYNQRSSQYAPHHFSPYAGRSDAPTSTRSADDLQDISRNRVSHFNYLPPTLKPELESSNSTKASNLNVLLNPSPSSRNGKKSKRKKKGFSFARSAGNTPGSSYQGSSQASPEDNNAEHISPNDHPNSVPSFNDDEGIDFWENLRSLAGRPTSPQEKATQTSIPFDEENRAIFYGLFNGVNNDVETTGMNKAGPNVSYPLDGDSFIPFNPS